MGAGPAGAMSALALARRQLRVLLVDKAAFPRSKVCGSCLNGRALALLDAFGLGSLPVRLGGVRLEAACLAAKGRQARLPLPGGMSLSRFVFDAGLIEAAIEAGAHFLPETTASLASPHDVPAQRELCLKQHDATVQASARIVIAADGLGGRLLGERRPRADSRIGVGVLLPDRSGYAPGAVYLACGTGGYVGVVCVEHGQLDVAAALDTAFLRSMGSAGEAARVLFEEAGLPCPAGVVDADWRGTQPLTHSAPRLGDHRLFLVGDTAGYVEPFTGEGIAWALAGAAALAPIAAQGVRDWQPGLVAEWSSLHRQIVGRRQRTCRALAWLLRRPRLTSLLLGTLARWPGLARPFVRQLNGPADTALSAVDYGRPPDAVRLQ
ncbi:MAG: NAD(P)/FAD-dependent oxidoreductase [Gemmataceae bacterium]